MKEIEVKVLNINRKKVEKQLIDMGAIKIFDDEVEARYFDLENNPIRTKNNVLRLRKMGKRYFLTYKEKASKEKVTQREEYETEVENYEIMIEILHNMGFKEWIIVHKHRTSYELNGVLFEFDKYKEDYEIIPEFMEIEAKDEKTIFKYVDLLNLNRNKCKAIGFSGLRKLYSEKK